MAMLVDERRIRDVLTFAVAVDRVEESFRRLWSGDWHNEPRRRTSHQGAGLNVMWAHAPSLDTLAVKCYPVVRSDVRQASVTTVLLFAQSTGECLAIVEGDLLGRIRTAAASAVAARVMARPDGTTATLFGTGYQALTQATAIGWIMPKLERLNVVGRNPERTLAFAARLDRILPGISIGPAEPEPAVRASDLIVTATGSSTPVLDGTWVRPGTHITAIGSNQREHAELDAGTMRRATRIVVDDLAVAELECGDLAANDVPFSAAVPLGEILETKPPRGDDDITIFESQGLATQDLACARYVYDTIGPGDGPAIDFPNGPDDELPILT